MIFKSSFHSFFFKKELFVLELGGKKTFLLKVHWMTAVNSPPLFVWFSTPVTHVSFAETFDVQRPTKLSAVSAFD